VLEKKLETI